MKSIYLICSIIFTTLILVIFFENLSTNSQIAFFNLQVKPVMAILGVAVIGIITGAFYHAFMGRVIRDSAENEKEAMTEKAEEPTIPQE